MESPRDHCQCLANAFSSIPNEIIPVDDKTNMVETLSQAREEKYVRECMKDVSRNFRRKRYDGIAPVRKRVNTIKGCFTCTLQ